MRYEASLGRQSEEIVAKHHPTPPSELYGGVGVAPGRVAPRPNSGRVATWGAIHNSHPCSAGWRYHPTYTLIFTPTALASLVTGRFGARVWACVTSQGRVWALGLDSRVFTPHVALPGSQDPRQAAPAGPLKAGSGLCP